MLVCTHTLRKLQRCFRTKERHKRYEYNSSHVGYDLKVSQQSNGNPLYTRYKARRGGLNPTNAVSRINVAILVFLDPVYQRMQNSTDHAVQNHVCWQGGIFTSGALESLSSLTGQQMKNRVQAASALQVYQICFFDTKFPKFEVFRDSRRQKKCLFFSIFVFLEAVGTCYQLS